MASVTRWVSLFFAIYNNENLSNNIFFAKLRPNWQKINTKKLPKIYKTLPKWRILAKVANYGQSSEFWPNLVTLIAWTTKLTEDKMRRYFISDPALRPPRGPLLFGVPVHDRGRRNGGQRHRPQLGNGDSIRRNWVPEFGYGRRAGHIWN